MWSKVVCEVHIKGREQTKMVLARRMQASETLTRHGVAPEQAVCDPGGGLRPL